MKNKKRIKNLEPNVKIIYVPMRNNNRYSGEEAIAQNRINYGNVGYGKVPFRPRFNKPVINKGFNTQTKRAYGFPLKRRNFQLVMTLVGATKGH